MLTGHYIRLPGMITDPLYMIHASRFILNVSMDTLTGSLNMVTVLQDTVKDSQDMFTSPKTCFKSPIYMEHISRVILNVSMDSLSGSLNMVTVSQYMVTGSQDMVTSSQGILIGSQDMQL
jgi:hypothetical protein